MALLVCMGLCGCVQEARKNPAVQQLQAPATKVQATLKSADLLIEQDASAQEIRVQVKAYADTSATEIDLQQRDDTLYIVQHPSQASQRGSGRLEVHVTVPQTELEIVDIHTTSGEVKMQGVAMRRGYIETASGDVNAVDVAAQELETATVSGEQKLVRVAARALEMYSTSGDVTGRQVAAGTLRAYTTSAEMRWEELAAQAVEMESVSGELYAVYASSTQMLQAQLKSVSGDIRCAVPGNLALRILANRTVEGGENSDKGADNTLKLSTVSGRLTVQTR